MELPTHTQPNPSCSKEQPPKTLKLIVNNSNIIPQGTMTGNQVQQAYKVKLPGLFTEPVEYRVLPVKIETSGEQYTEEEESMPMNPIIQTTIPTDATKLTIVTPEVSRTQSPMVVQGSQMFVLSDTGTLTNATIAPTIRAGSASMNPRMVSSREEKRRVTHNEVERKRRDKINQWILKLSRILPAESQCLNKTLQSKGIVLANACDHIVQLREENENLSKEVANLLPLTQETEILKKENSQLKNENALLREKLAAHGLLDS